MRAAVTGGAGFIGSHLVDRLLEAGHAVEVVDDLSTGSLDNLAAARGRHSGSLGISQLDVRSPACTDLVARVRPAVVFHLAAQADVRRSVADPVLDAEVNIVGTLRVMEGLRRAGGGRVVLAASGGTLYGEPGPEELPVPESHPQHPLSPYGVSKKSAIDYLVAYRHLHGLDYCALALGNVYGPRQDPHGEAGVAAIFAGRLLAGQDCTVYGDGEQTRDFVYVDDVVDAFVAAASAGSGLVLNVGTGNETSVNELYWTLAGQLGCSRPPVHAPARPGELRRSCLDPTLAARSLGWQARTPLAAGCAALLEHLRSGT